MDGFIFDLDGTLADTLGDIARAANHVLATLGLPTHSEQRIGAMVGDGAALLVRRMLPPDRADQVDAVLVRFREHYLRHLLDTTRLYPGVAELLAALTAGGGRMAVLSNKPHDMTQAIVRGLLAEVPFVAVWGQLPERPKKPDPSAAFALAAALGVAPGDCAFVGDTPVDMQTGVRAGMVPVGVAWGFRPVPELRAAGAAVIADCPADLLALRQ